MAISRITSQDAIANSGSNVSSITATYAGSTTAGNLLIAVLNTEGITTGISISGWSTLVSGHTFNPTTYPFLVFYKLADGSETNVQATWTTASPAALDIFEYTGNANPIVVDGTAAINNANGTAVNSPWTTPSISTSNANDLIFYAVNVVGGTTVTSPAWATGTLFGSNFSSGNTSIWCGEDIVSSNQSGFTDNFSWTGGNTHFIAAAIGAFQAVGGGGGPAPPATFARAPTVMVIR